MKQLKQSKYLVKLFKSTVFFYKGGVFINFTARILPWQQSNQFKFEIAYALSKTQTVKK